MNVSNVISPAGSPPIATATRTRRVDSSARLSSGRDATTDASAERSALRYAAFGRGHRVEEVTEDRRLHVRRVDALRQEVRLARDDQRPGARLVGEPAVRALHEAGVERNQVHQHAEAE